MGKRPHGVSGCELGRRDGDHISVLNILGLSVHGGGAIQGKDVHPVSSCLPLGYTWPDFCSALQDSPFHSWSCPPRHTRPRPGA